MSNTFKITRSPKSDAVPVFTINNIDGFDNLVRQLKTYGVKKGEIKVIAAGVGVGKTQMEVDTPSALIKVSVL